MENQVKVFESAEFGSVRTVEVSGVPYFVGRDVATILGYKNIRDAISNHVDEEDKGVAKCDTLGGTQEMVVINESGLYSLILGSKLPNAKKFKRWVTSEVLPSIRKHGMYATDELLANPDFAIQVFQELKAEREKRSQLENTVATQKNIIQEKNTIIAKQQPKVKYCDDVLNNNQFISTTIIAKDLGITARELNDLLHKNKIIYKSGSCWTVYKKYDWLITNGYADYISYPNHNYSPQLKWSEKGRKWIIDNFLSDIYMKQLSNISQ